jgi:predicted nuclease of restriction endonuclease-like RecB superfamily
VLTADLVNARRRGNVLHVTALDEDARVRAAAMADVFLNLARDHVGRTREELEEAWGAVEVDGRDRRLADGLCKLVEDRCALDAETTFDPEALRRELFLRATTARREGTFDRDRILDEVATARVRAAENLERDLYADLREAQVLQAILPTTAALLVEAYDLGQAQAVLLRAVRVRVVVACATPGAYRALFQRLKFLRLLHTIIADAGGGYRIDIDGPYSLFDAVTKYGLQLALALPVIREADQWSLEADIRWGKERAPLVFRLEGGQRKPARKRRTNAREDAVAPPAAPPDEASLPDEVAALLRGLRALDTPWAVTPAATILDLPGVGLCVPDLVFRHGKTDAVVHLEILGFWSRAAVWRRVDLVEQGLGGKIVFAVSQRLRVSEDVLGDVHPGALYVYKGVMNARAVLAKVETVAARG